MAAKGYKFVERRNKFTMKELSMWYERLNTFIHKRSKVKTRILYKWKHELVARLADNDTTFNEVSAMKLSPKNFKSAIEDLGGHLCRDVFHRALIGTKGFLISAIREITSHFIPWSEAFGPTGRGIVLWNDKLMGPNTCWWCGRHINHVPIVLDQGFAAPWCSNGKCRELIRKKYGEYVEWVECINGPLLLKLSAGADEEDGDSQPESDVMDDALTQEHGTYVQMKVPQVEDPVLTAFMEESVNHHPPGMS